MKKTKDIVISILVGLCVGWLLHSVSFRPKERVRVVSRTDTVYTRDTLRLPVPEPEKVWTVRCDTVYVTVHDTVSVPVYLPVERKEYRTPDYRAVVEGYRPELVSMTLYPPLRTVYRTDTRTVTLHRRWGVGLQAGAGMTGKGVTPYIGFGLQYNLWSW